MTNPRDDLMALADRLRELVFRQGQIDWDALIKIEIDLRLAASRPAPVDREAVARAICQSGKFETGEGTCALLCMDQLGSPRKKGCCHSARVHGKLADSILSLLRPAEPVEAKQRDTWSAAKHDEIINRLMMQIGMPNSRSLYQAFKQFANELHHMDLGASATAPQPTTPDAVGEPDFQKRVLQWMMACFSMEVCRDGRERNHRFLEEAMELVQSLGCTASEAHQLVEYVFNRPLGEPKQELGGVMVTLAALCFPHGLNMVEAGETELARIWDKIEVIREKQANKPKHSPLPQHTHPPKSPDTSVAVLAERERCAKIAEDPERQNEWPKAVDVQRTAPTQLMQRAIAAAIRQLPTESKS